MLRHRKQIEWSKVIVFLCGSKRRQSDKCTCVIGFTCSLLKKWETCWDTLVPYFVMRSIERAQKALNFFYTSRNFVSVMLGKSFLLFCKKKVPVPFESTSLVYLHSIIFVRKLVKFILNWLSPYSPSYIYIYIYREREREREREKKLFYLLPWIKELQTPFQTYIQ